MRSTQFLRGDGGCGSYGAALPPPEPLAGTKPDRTVDYATIPQAALIYRLSGDEMPLHADPEVARAAGFRRPILHGLCTMGMACRAVLRTYCTGRPEAVRSMFTRFSAPAFPGETIRFELFDEPGRIRFRARALERDVLLLDRGECILRDSSAA